MISLLLAFATLFASDGSAAAVAPPGPAQQLIQRIRESALREPPGLEIQSLVTAAELLRRTKPAGADSLIQDCLTILQSGKPIDAQVTTRVLEVAMQINASEVLRKVQFVPDRRAVANALISYYLNRRCLKRAIALIDQSRRQGLTDLSGAILVLRQLMQQQPGDGAAFFHEMLSSAPAALNPEEALFLLSAVREVVLANPQLALRAVFRIAISAQSGEFSRGFPGTLTAKYRIGGRDVWATDVHDCVLLPALAYLRVLAPDRYAEFASGSEQERLLSGVTSETLLKSTQPLQVVWLKSDLAPTSKAEVIASAGREISQRRSASFLPVQPRETESESSLDGLFERLKRQESSNRARRAIESQALQEIRRMPPDRQRVGAAAELLSLTAGHENAARLQPITALLLSSLFPLAHGTRPSSVGGPEDVWCASMYSFVALQIHQHHITTSDNDPSLATRLALLDLRDLLQETYDFTMKDRNGRQYSLRQFRGHVVLLRFWSPRCGTCVRSLPELEKFYRENALKKIVPIAISEEPEATTRPFLETRGYTFPFLSDQDGAVSGYFGISVIPSTIVIDPEGRIAGSIVGEASGAQLGQILDRAKSRERKSRNSDL